MLYGDDILWILVMLSGDDDGDSKPATVTKNIQVQTEVDSLSTLNFVSH